MKKIVLIALMVIGVLIPTMGIAGDNKNNLVVFSGDYVFPQIVDGGGWKTSFTFVNISDKPISFSLFFVDDTGKGLPLSFTGVSGTGTGINFTNLPIMGSVTLESTGTASTTSQGWAGINVPDSTTRVAGTAIFKRSMPGLPDTEAVVPLSSIFDFRQAMPFDNTGGYLQGVELPNPSSGKAITVTFNFRATSGVSFFQDTLTPQPGNHTSFLVSQRWSQTANRRGTIEITTPELTSTSLSVCVIGLRGSPSGGLSTVFPLVSPTW